jgi:RimJ/RimL family protein N-acetyltransferase
MADTVPVGVTEIVTARLRLRRARADDFDPIHAMLSDARAMRYWSTLPHESRAVSEKWFADQFFSGDPARDEWIIEFEGRAVGFIGTWKQPEFGFMLAPEVWGQGLATEAATAFLAYAFATYPLEAVTADVDPRNAASLGVMRKLGFVETGRAERTFLIGGEWCDSVYLALPRPS